MMPVPASFGSQLETPESDLREGRLTGPQETSLQVLSFTCFVLTLHELTLNRILSP